MDSPQKRRKAPPKGSFQIIRTGVRIGGKRGEPRYRVLRVPGTGGVRVPAQKTEEEEISIEDEPLFDIPEPEYVPDIEDSEDSEPEDVEEPIEAPITYAEKRDAILGAYRRRKIALAREKRDILQRVTPPAERSRILKGFHDREERIEKEKTTKLQELEEEVHEEEGPSAPSVPGVSEPEILKRFREWEKRQLLDEKPKVFGPRKRIERVTEFEEETVKVPMTQRQKELARRFRIAMPKTQRRIVGKTKTRPVRELEITYDITRRARVGPFGVLIPLKGGRQTEPLGDTLPRRRYPTVQTSAPRVLPRREGEKPVSPPRIRSQIMNASEFYGISVTQEIRDAIVQLIFEVVSEKRMPIARATLKARHEKEELLLGRPLLPGLTQSEASETPPLKIPKAEYTEMELKTLVRREIFDQLKPPKSALKKRAEKITEEKRDLKNILDGMEKRLGSSIFKKLWTWDGEFLWNQLQNLNDETEIEFILRTFLQGKTSAERKRIRGDQLRNLITKAIALYRQRLLTLKKDLIRDLEMAWLRENLEKRFQKEKPSLMKKWGDQIEKAWKKYSEEYDKKYGGMVSGKLTKAGQEIYRQIQEMEQGLFDRAVRATTNLTLLTYLKNVLYPVLFLDTIGDIGRHAKFFHTKLQSGAIEISALPDATLAHYIPEVTMELTEKETSSDWEMIGERLAQDLKRRIDEFIALFMIRKGKRVRFPPPLSYFSWTRFLKEPQNICFQDTKTGYYSEKTRKPIPDSDLIICYAKGVGFTCYSILQLVWATVRGKNDPVTGKPYPRKLIQRMKRQYPDMFEKAQQEYTEALKLEKELFDEEAED